MLGLLLGLEALGELLGVLARVLGVVEVVVLLPLLLLLPRRLLLRRLPLVQD